MTTPRDAFIEAAFWHGSRERADAVLAEHPEIADDIHVAAMLGRANDVARHIERAPALAASKAGPRNVEPLVHLCFSVYLRDPERSDDFARAATTLLDAGADIRGGFYDATHTPSPCFESLLYGAAGVHFNAPLTRVLLERGADPNDDETPYHSPETYDNAALQLLLDSGRLTPVSLTTMLLRKADWHDADGMRRVLDAGADPNAEAHWGRTPLHHAILRDNDLEMIDMLLEYGGDPTRVASKLGRSAVSMAARRGRGDVLRAIQDRDFPLSFNGVESLIAACALDDDGAIAKLTAIDPSLVTALHADGATLLAEFAGTSNTAGVGHLIDLGVPVDARYAGDSYFGIAPESTALHVAAWRASQPVIELLIERGADVNAADARGRTPLQLAVLAATESYWKWRRTPDGVKALLQAGATCEGIRVPTGYEEIDTLLSPA